MTLDKDQMRAKIKQQRSTLDSREWSDWSERIQRRLKEHDLYKQAESIHCYVSMNKRNEVDTHSILRHSLVENKIVYIPVMQAEKNQLSHAKLLNIDDLKPNAWGVPEPENEVLEDIISPDLIIIPLLAADKNGNRLGYGKGYYDQFLATTNTTKLGLVFDLFVMDQIPVEAHDIPLDYLITETQTIKV